MIGDDDLARRNEALERTIAKMQEAKAAGFRDVAFDMTSWFARNGAYDCGTSACIAGWVVHANSNFEIPELVDIGKGKNGNIPERARVLLRLSHDEASALFFAQNSEVENLSLPGVTIDHAIAMLAHFRATGEISWSALPDLDELIEQ